MEQGERPVVEPFSLVFHGKPPKSFGGLHREITERLPSLPQLSSLASRTKAYQRYTVLLDELDVASQSPKIVEGENGGIMLFHISPDPDQLIQTLYLNDLQTRPGGEVSWGRRCFGARLACFTDPSIIKEQLKRRKLNSQNVIGIESDGMRDQHEVVVEDGYRTYMTDWVLDFVTADSKLKSELERVKTLFSTEDGVKILDQRLQRLKAFYVSGLVIDLFCALNPRESRLSYRTEIQNKYRGGIPFGYRKYTDEIFLSPNAMLGTVNHMMDLGDLPDKRKGTILRTTEHFLDRIKGRENEFIGSKYLFTSHS